MIAKWPANEFRIWVSLYNPLDEEIMINKLVKYNTILTLTLLSIGAHCQTKTPLTDSIVGEYSYVKKTKNYEIGGGLEISHLSKPTKYTKYKARFNGYYAKGDMPNMCEFEGNLNLISRNVFSLKNQNDEDIKYNLVVIIDKSDLLIYSTDAIEGCGQNADMSVQSRYKKK